MRKLLTSSPRGQRGGALVEFAVVAPLLFMMLIGSIQFGTIMYRYHATDYAARLGARWASVHGADCSYSAAPCPTTNAAVQTYVLGHVPGLSNTATAVPSWAVPSSTSYVGLQQGNAPSKCDLADQTANCLVTVTVTNPFSVTIPFIKTFTYSLQSTSTVVEQ